MTTSVAGPVSALVLAAGGSTRLGEPKQAVRLDGQTLLRRTTRLAASCVDGSVNVVIGANAAADRTELADEPVEIHEFARWRQGQAASLSFGLRHIRAGHAALVLVVDQYRLNRGHLGALLEAWREAPQCPAAASYSNIEGVPVVWPSGAIASLVSSGRPGRDVLAAHRCTTVPLPAARFDVDTPLDLEQLRRFERSNSG
ncbi:MAG: NTP transferase domain-containing protein [Gammaproteobacteria bacterium]